MADTKFRRDASRASRYQVGHFMKENRWKNKQVEPDAHQCQILLEYQNLGRGDERRINHNQEEAYHNTKKTAKENWSAENAPREVLGEGLEVIPLSAGTRSRGGGYLVLLRGRIALRLLGAGRENKPLALQ